MKKSFITSIILASLLSSCMHKHYSVSGKTITELRTVSYYNSINVEGSIDVFITHDTSYSVKVEAGENLMDYIETDVVNQELIIRQSKSNVVNAKPVKVYLNVDNLSRIETHGSGNLNTDELTSTYFELNKEGSGNADIHINADTIITVAIGSGNCDYLGNVSYHKYSIDGSGNLSARYLYSSDSDISIEGSGNATIYVSNNLNASIDGSGNIYYYGNPSNVNYQINGSGQLIQK